MARKHAERRSFEKREILMSGTRTKAVMDKKRLEYYKKKLLARREELMKTIARTQEEGRTATKIPRWTWRTGGELLHQKNSSLA